MLDLDGARAFGAAGILDAFLWCDDFCNVGGAADGSGEEGFPAMLIAVVVAVIFAVETLHGADLVGEGVCFPGCC